MVEYSNELNGVFGSLSDPTRRDILKRLSKRSLSVGGIANHYKLTFAAIAKHLEVMERAGLVTKTRSGKEQIVSIVPKALASANGYLENYRQIWENRLGSLDIFLQSINKTRRGRAGRKKHATN
jgi:DNA-binding transcriptional ArsR family regulator